MRNRTKTSRPHQWLPGVLGVAVAGWVLWGSTGRPAGAATPAASPGKVWAALGARGAVAMVGGHGVGLSAPALSVAWRPGGGSHFSGGSHYSGGGGYHGGGGHHSGSGHHGGGLSGGGGGDLIELIIGLVVFGIFGLFSVASKVLRGPGAGDAWESGAGSWEDASWEPDAPARPRAVDLSPLWAEDPHFSKVLLEDFLYSLYARAQECRGGQHGGLDGLAPYLSAEARENLASRGGRPVADVTGVIVGALQIEAFSQDETSSYLKVLFETNYSEVYPPDASGRAAAPVAFYCRDRFYLSRRRGAQSRPPDKVYEFHCPSCGAPVTSGSQDEQCEYCGTYFGSGELDWFVDRIQLVQEETRGPLLTGTVQEAGTNLPTLHAPSYPQRLAELGQRDPAFRKEDLLARHALIFDAVGRAWSSLEWERVRPFCTDRFFLSQTYWIRAYRQQNLRNVLDRSRITRVVIAKVETDAYFDAITLRFWATGLDYTVHDVTGRIVSGSNTVERFYSEYWTLVRSVRAQGPARADQQCPSCGGPLDVNQAGQCDHCGAKVTSGQFDWVLSKIEQDEAYRG